MNIKLILIAFVIAGVTSCTTAYKIGQTPDDVYFSPVPEQNVYVSTNNDENKYYGDRERNRDSYDSYGEDREIRRRINNRRWRRYDIDYGYNYYPYSYGNNYPYSYYPYSYGNNYPYGYYPYSYNYPWVYVDPKTGTSPSVYNKPRKFNLGTYRNSPTINNNNTYNPKSNYPGIRTDNNAPVRTFEKPRISTGTKVGNTIRRVFSTPNSNTNSNIYRNENSSSPSRSFEPARTTTSSSRPSPSTSTQSSDNAPVRKFDKK